MLCNWLLLSDLIRFDCAVHSLYPHLSTMYSDCNYSFSDKEKLQSFHLDKLLIWMKARNVYFERLSITTNETAPQWAKILEWTGSKVRISLYTDMIEVISLFCMKLERMKIDLIDSSPRHLQDILCNNVCTLKSLHLNTSQLFGNLSPIILDLPALQITDLTLNICNDGNVLTLLSKCPHLISLCLEDFRMNDQDALCFFYKLHATEAALFGQYNVHRNGVAFVDCTGLSEH